MSYVFQVLLLVEETLEEHCQVISGLISRFLSILLLFLLSVLLI